MPPADFTNRADVLAIQQHRAARRAVKRRQYVQQRRFARPRFAHNGDILALIHREGHIRQRLHLIAPEPRRIHLANILCFQQCHDSSSSKAALFPRVNFLLTRLFYHAPDRTAIESGDILPVLCDISVRWGDFPYSEHAILQRKISPFGNNHPAAIVSLSAG